MRWTMTRVFPEPAPASTSSGPSVVVTASRCGGFRVERSIIERRAHDTTAGARTRLDARGQRSAATAAARSAGHGARASTRAPSDGRGKASDSAWSAWRSMTGEGTPYTGSPSTGHPASASCTRIWCVRPVSRTTRRSAAPRSRSTTSNESRARRADATRVVNRRGSSGLRPYAVSRAPASGGAPATRARYSFSTAPASNAPCSAARAGSVRASEEAPARVAVEAVRQPRRGAAVHVEGAEPARGAGDRGRALPGGQHREPGRLRDDGAVGVVVEEDERGADRGDRPGGRQRDLHLLASEQLPLGRAGLPADPDLARRDERAGAVEGDRQGAGEEAVEPLAPVPSRDDETVGP